MMRGLGRPPVRNRRRSESAESAADRRGVRRPVGGQQRAEQDLVAGAQPEQHGPQRLGQATAGEALDAVVHARHREKRIEVVGVTDRDLDLTGRPHGGVAVPAEEQRQLTQDRAGSGTGQLLHRRGVLPLDDEVALEHEREERARFALAHQEVPGRERARLEPLRELVDLTLVRVACRSSSDAKRLCSTDPPRSTTADHAARRRPPASGPTVPAHPGTTNGRRASPPAPTDRVLGEQEGRHLAAAPPPPPRWSGPGHATPEALSVSLISRTATRVGSG